MICLCAFCHEQFSLAKPLNTNPPRFKGMQLLRWMDEANCLKPACGDRICFAPMLLHLPETWTHLVLYVLWLLKNVNFHWAEQSPTPHNWFLFQPRCSSALSFWGFGHGPILGFPLASGVGLPHVYVCKIPTLSFSHQWISVGDQILNICLNST